MYLGVDIGGTKTLVAVFDERSKVLQEVKFPTPKKYDNWLLELRHTVTQLEHQDFKAAGVAVPGRLNREEGLVYSLGNLPWKNEPIQADCEKVLHCPVVIENDANLAGLSESMLYKDKETVLYVTVSTGIGTAVMHNQVLDPALLDSEGGHIMLPFRGKLVDWEDFASGRAIYEHFGKKASEIAPDDEEAWGYIARNLSLGLFDNIAVVQPNLIIIGGSIGTYLKHYEKLLVKALRKYEVPIVPIPPIVQAQRPEEAVIYGCFDLAKQRFGHHAVAAH
ncbi:MAG TPA: ROK family protein [Candidatus Saccharimonadales bacterium]|nr:ROK family protein [Candidatus Saccharimonadales bacterium]